MFGPSDRRVHVEAYVVCSQAVLLGQRGFQTLRDRSSEWQEKTLSKSLQDLKDLKSERPGLPARTSGLCSENSANGLSGHGQLRVVETRRRSRWPERPR